MHEVLWILTCDVFFFTKQKKKSGYPRKVELD